ncbi:MAG TPA: DUF5666 domain-containing protein, partial [Dehalococcoidia bacterium]|nr:DUF5666 domain-containing protein [Dehalococcoidia bacterium]
LAHLRGLSAPSPSSEAFERGRQRLMASLAAAGGEKRSWPWLTGLWARFRLASPLAKAAAVLAAAALLGGALTASATAGPGNLPSRVIGLLDNWASSPKGDRAEIKGAEAQLEGRIMTVDCTTQLLTVNVAGRSFTVAIDGKTEIEDRRGRQVDCSELQSNMQVKVEGTLRDDESILARGIKLQAELPAAVQAPPVIEIEPTAAAQPTPTPQPQLEARVGDQRVEIERGVIEIRGLVRSLRCPAVVVEAAGMTFTVVTTAGTEIKGSHGSRFICSQLTAGTSVRVEGSQEASGTVLAREIEIEDVAGERQQEDNSGPGNADDRPSHTPTAKPTATPRQDREDNSGPSQGGNQPTPTPKPTPTAKPQPDGDEDSRDDGDEEH